MKKDFENAAKLTCLKGNCNGSATSAEAAGSNGTIVASERSIKTCCNADEIADNALFVTKIDDVKIKKNAAQIILEAEDSKKQKRKYINCLARESDNNYWKVTRFC